MTVGIIALITVLIFLCFLGCCIRIERLEQKVKDLELNDEIRRKDRRI